MGYIYILYYIPLHRNRFCLTHPPGLFLKKCKKFQLFVCTRHMFRVFYGELLALLNLTRGLRPFRFELPCSCRDNTLPY